METSSPEPPAAKRSTRGARTWVMTTTPSSTTAQSDKADLAPRTFEVSHAARGPQPVLGDARRERPDRVAAAPVARCSFDLAPHVDGERHRGTTGDDLSPHVELAELPVAVQIAARRGHVLRAAPAPVAVELEAVRMGSREREAQARPGRMLPAAGRIERRRARGDVARGARCVIRIGLGAARD